LSAAQGVVLKLLIDTLQSSVDSLTDSYQDLSTLKGRDENTYTLEEGDFGPMIVAIHQSLKNYQSVCRNFAYLNSDNTNSNSVLVIGNRYTAERGRYLVLPRTNVNMYSYQIKDGLAHNVRTFATTQDLESYALKSDLTALQEEVVTLKTELAELKASLGTQVTYSLDANNNLSINPIE